MFYEKLCEILYLLKGNIDANAFMKLFENFSDLVNEDLLQKRYIHIMKDCLFRLLNKRKFSPNQISKIKYQILKLKDRDMKEILFN